MGRSGRHASRRRAHQGAATAACILLLGLVLAPHSGVLAAGSAGATFAEAFDRARLVVVATVEAAPPADAAYRLAVEVTVKGETATELTFPAEMTSVTLEPGTRIVLLAMDPRSLDFRGTWTLAVAPDGAIDGDGFAGAPATVDELLESWGTAGPGATHRAGPAATPSTAPGEAPRDDGSWSPVTAAAIAALAAIGFVVALVAGWAAHARRRRAGGT